MRRKKSTENGTCRSTSILKFIGNFQGPQDEPYEIYFKEKDVRFIAIDSHVDNSRSDSLEFAPMLNVLNEMYLHDLSKKVNIGFRAKECRGNRLRQRRCSAISEIPKIRTIG